MNEFTVRLDLAKGKARQQQTVFVRQGDKNATTIVATITDHGAAASTSGMTARFQMRLPNGTEYYRKAASLSGNVATVALDEAQAASVAGRTDVAYFQLLQGSTVVASTESFTVVVLPDALADAEVAESYDSAIQDAIDALDAAVEQMPETVETVLADHPEWTTTVQDGSITKAKLATDLARDRERLQYRLANMLTNALPEGETATATDAAKTPAAGLALYGRSTQDGTPTPSAVVPIVSVAGNVVSEVKTGLFVNSSTSVIGTSAGAQTAVAHVSRNTDYTLTYEGGNRCIVGGVDSPNIASGDTVRILFNSSSRVSPKTFNSGENDYVAMYVATSAAPAANIALYAGSTVCPYVPYGHAGLWARGKNLLNIPGWWSTTTAASGITCTVNADGSVTTSGTASASSDVIDYVIGTGIPIAPLEPGSYVLTGCPANGSTSTYALALRGVRADGTTKFYLSDYGSGTTVTLAEGEVIDRVYINVKSGVNMDGKVFYPMLRRAGTGADFATYTKTVTPIDLDGHELRSLPDGTRDEVAVDQYGHVTLVQRVGEFTITQDLANAAYSYANLGSVGRAVMWVGPSTTPAAAQVKSDNGLCTAAPWKSSYTENSIHAYVTKSSNASLAVVFAQGSTAVEVASKFVGEQFLYEMATPVTHDLGTIDPVPLVGPDLTAQAVPTAPFALTYERDLNTTLARLESAIATLA